MLRLFRTAAALAPALAILMLWGAALHAGPYVPQGPPFVDAAPGFGLPTPTDVPGKEYSNRTDRAGHDRTPAVLTPHDLDPEQVITWDGAGGTSDARADFATDIDYTGTRAGDAEDREIDALANKQDLLFSEVITDKSYLLFSVGYASPGTSGDDHIYFETPMPLSYPAGLGGPLPVADGGIWAAPAEVESDTAFLSDVDALEVWGPGTIAPVEDLFNLPPNGVDGPGYNDSNRYSLEGDPDVDGGAGALDRVAVWNSTGTPYIDSATIIAAITSLSVSGALNAQEEAAVDLDALMVFDQAGDTDFSLGDRILFSVAPIADDNGDTVGGLEFDGGEIFVYTLGDPSASFLFHGDHLWDTAFSVADTLAAYLGVDPGDVSENINALEAVSIVVEVPPDMPVPEPTTLLLMLLGIVGTGMLARRPAGRRVHLATALLALGVLPAASPALVSAAAIVPVNSGTVGVQNEVSVTLNPAQSGNVVIAYNDDPSALSTQGLGISYSTDSGNTWTDRQIGVPAPTDPSSGTTMADIFDPVTGADTQGNVFAGYIATDGAQGGPSGVYVHRSTDGGNTWTSPIAVHNNAAELFAGDPTYRFNDKPHLTVDRFAGSPNTDDLYMAWIQDDGQTAPSNIVFSASTDGGNTWFGAPVVVNDNLGGPNTDMANGPNVAVAPNGDVYVAWLDVDVTNQTAGPKAGTLYIDRSSNGGVTFGPDQMVKPVDTLPNHLSTLNNQALQDDVRARGYPVIGTDPNDPLGNTVYMVYAEDPDGTIVGDEADIFFLRSLDGGNSWSPRLRVNDDATINDQFAPWMAVKPDGTIDLVWYDKRNDPNDAMWDVYFARSIDGGQSFQPNVRITSTLFATAVSSGNEPWLGEYLGLAVDSNVAYIGFTSPTTTDPNGDIFFARALNAVPEPSSLGLAVGLALVAACGRGRRGLRRRRGL